MTVLLRTRAELAEARAAANGRVGAVFTMGALHEGHTALLRTARAQCDVVVATVFVNPAQFGPGEDFARYPRPLEADLARCEEAGVDVVWAPAVDEVYRREPTTSIDGGELSRQLEGAVRPGHFGGMLLVVCKLLHLTQPAVTFFGEKDYQQLTLVRAMCADLDLPVEVVAVPTEREPDGLARSSRNAYLSPEDRSRAASLWRALSAGRAAASGGDGATVLAAARAELTDVAVDYLELRSPSLTPAPSHGPARLLVAARFGTTRLIDNIELTLT